MQPFPRDSSGDGREIPSGNRTVSFDTIVLCGNLPYQQSDGFGISTLPFSVSPPPAVGTLRHYLRQEEASRIKLSQLRGQLPATRAKYKDAIEACGSLDYIEYNVSQIARRFGLNGTDLGRQLRTHYPGIIEWREKVRKRLGLNDNLPRGTRKVCKEQYAEAVKLLRADRYITVQEAAERCNVSYSGLEQHLIFYHKELVENRIKIRERAVRQQRKGKITGRGTLHTPTPETITKYAEALHLYRTTPMSARK